MKASKRKKLEAAGWKVGSASEFLELSDAEAMLISMKLALANNIKEMRLSQQITQEGLAKLIGSSQSRVAKLEAADRSVSIELLIKSLVTLGASRTQIGNIVGTRNKTHVGTRGKTQKKKSGSKKQLVKA